MRVIVDEIALHRDQRGLVFEPLDEARLATQRNVHVVLTEPGCIRGNHYHRKGTEVITVYGPALVRLREDAELEERIVAEGQALRFTIPPGISHAVKNTGDRPNLLIAFNSEVHNWEAPDVVSDVLIER
jgi:dTDP-4-dehydrorhamnose 3,5-epimerase-like enzyme